MSTEDPRVERSDLQSLPARAARQQIGLRTSQLPMALHRATACAERRRPPSELDELGGPADRAGNRSRLPALTHGRVKYETAAEACAGRLPNFHQPPVPAA